MIVSHKSDANFEQNIARINIPKRFGFEPEPRRSIPEGLPPNYRHQLAGCILLRFLVTNSRNRSARSFFVIIFISPESGSRRS